MIRLGGVLLLCLACGSTSGTPGLVDHDEGDGQETGGSAGAMVASGGGGTQAMGGQAGGGVAGAQLGGAAQTGGATSGGSFTTGGTFPTGGAFPTGGTSTGGAFPTGGSSSGAPTGGFSQGGSVATGGAGTGGIATGGLAGTAGRLLWSQEFTYTGTQVVGTSATHELVFYRTPTEQCLLLSPDPGLPHGMTGTATIGPPVTELGTCLGYVTNPEHRHLFRIMSGTSGVTQEVFRLPPESEMWRPTRVVRRVTQNEWAQGAVNVRETWELWQ